MRARRRGATYTFRVLVVVLLALGLVASALPVAARPYGARGRSGEVRYGVPASQVERRCARMTDSAGNKLPLCVHWVTSGQHRPRSGWVKATRDSFQKSWNVAVKARAYRRPLPDKGAPAYGPNKGLDVYIANIDGDGTFGFCQPDRGVSGEAVPAYCVVDNDFSDVSGGTAKLRELRGTAAHEFFHAVQYAYDRSTPKWFSEGTAVWMEDQVFDGGNTNRRYLDITALRKPEDPLDMSSGSTGYGAWLFWQYVAERFHTRSSPGHTKVRAIWNAARKGSDTTPGIINATSRATGKPFGNLLADFGMWNYAVGAGWSYGEGGAYLNRLGGVRSPLDAEHELSVGSSTDVTDLDNEFRKVSAGPRSLHYIRVEAAAPMKVRVSVKRPTGFNGTEFGWVKHTAAGSFPKDKRGFFKDSTAVVSRKVSLQTGDAVILVLANPKGSSKTLQYRAKALQP